MVRSSMITLMDYTDGLSDASKETDDETQEEILDEIDDKKKSLTLGVEWIGSETAGYEDFKDSATKFFDTVLSFFKNLFGQITTLVVSDLKTVNAAIERWNKLKNNTTVTKPYELEIAKDGKACFSFAGLDWLSKRAPILYELQKAVSTTSPDIEKSIQELPDTSTTDDDIAKVQAGSEQVVTHVKSLYDGLNKAVAGKWFDTDAEVFPLLRYKANTGNGLPMLQVPSSTNDNVKLKSVKEKHYLAAGTKSNIERTYIEKELTTHKTFLEITNKVCADLKRIIESSSKDLSKVKKLFLALQSQTKTKNQAQAQGTTPPTPNPAQGKTGYVEGGLEAVRSDANDKNAVGQRAGAKLLACVKAWQRPAQLICTCCQKTIGDLKVSFKVASAAMDHFSAGAKTDEKKEETTTTTPQQGKTASMDDLLRLTPMARHMTLALGGSYLIEEQDEADSTTRILTEINHYFDLQSNDLIPSTEGFFDSLIEFFAGFFKAIGTFFNRLFGGGSGGGGGSSSATVDKVAGLLSDPKTKEAIQALEKAIAADPSFLQGVTWPTGGSRIPNADGIKGLLSMDYAANISKVLDGAEPVFRRIDQWAALFDKVAETLKTSGSLIKKNLDIKKIADTIPEMESEGKKVIDDLIVKAAAGSAIQDPTNPTPTVSKEIILKGRGGALTGPVDAAELTKLLNVLKDGEKSINKIRASLKSNTDRKDKLLANMTPKVDKLTKGLINLDKNTKDIKNGFASNKNLKQQVTASLNKIKKVKPDLVKSFQALLKCIAVPVQNLDYSYAIIGASVAFILRLKKSIPAAGTASLDYSLYATEDLFGHEDYSLLDPQVYNFFEVEVGLEDSDDDDKEFFLIRWVKWIWKKITGFFDWLFGKDSKEKDTKALDTAKNAAKNAQQQLTSAIDTITNMSPEQFKKITQSGKLFKGALTPVGMKKANELLSKISKDISTTEANKGNQREQADNAIKMLQTAVKKLQKAKSIDEYEAIKKELDKTKEALTASQTNPERSKVANDSLQRSQQNEQFAEFEQFLNKRNTKYYLQQTTDLQQQACRQLMQDYLEPLKTYQEVLARCTVIDVALERSFGPIEKGLETVLKDVQALKIDPKITEGYAQSKTTNTTDEKVINQHKKTIKDAFNSVKMIVTDIAKSMQSTAGRHKQYFRKIVNVSYGHSKIIINTITTFREASRKKDFNKAVQDAKSEIFDAKDKKNEKNEKNENQQQQGQQTAWFEPGLLTDDVHQFEFALESFKGIGTEGILDSVLGLLTGLANMVSRLFSTFKMIYRSFKDLKRTELHSYQEKYPASIFRVKRLSYQELSDVDVPLPKGLKTTYQDALQKTLTVLRACDMKTRSKAFVSVAKKLVSQLKTGIDTRTTTGGLYTQEQEVNQINNLFKKADQCFDGASATSKKFKTLFTSTEEFSTVHDLLDNGCQYEYEVASVYANLQECEELMNEAVAHAKSRKSLGNIPISKAELVSLSETCLFMAKTFDMYGLAVANFNKIEHNYVETLKAIMRKFNI